MRKLLGFSSGALAKGDFELALSMLSPHLLPCIELSALRVEEVLPLIETIPSLNLRTYEYISLHAPSEFLREEEIWLSDLLFHNVPKTWPIVMHPDAICDFACWNRFGNRLAIENMDRRKPIGRSSEELRQIFTVLPDASMCFDIGHARQYDSSMTEAFLILSEFADRLVQVHISEVNSRSKHDRISFGAKLAFQQLAYLIPQNVPIIVESQVPENQIAREITSAYEALGEYRPSEQKEKANLNPQPWVPVLQS